MVKKEPTSPVPVHTEGTLSAAEILLDLAGAGGRVVSDQDESARSLELQLDVHLTQLNSPLPLMVTVGVVEYPWTWCVCVAQGTPMTILGHTQSHCQIPHIPLVLAVA